jgi:hypothetical protein
MDDAEFIEQAAPAQQSFLSWATSAVPGPFLLLLLLTGFLSFVTALILVTRGRGAMAAAALVLVVHVPVFIGVLAALNGSINALVVIASSPVAPKPSEIAAGVSAALFSPLFGIALAAPGYGVAAVGAFVRAFSRQADSG